MIFGIELRDREVNMLSTKQYPPSKELLTYIDAYWSIKNNTIKSIDLPIVPDGCMDIIYKENFQKKDIVLVGAMDAGIIVSIAPQDYYFGIRFKPAILSFLLDQNMSNFSNNIISVKEVSDNIYNQLDFYEKNEELKIKKLNSIFEKEFSKIKINERIIYCVNLIIKNQGNILVEKIVKKSNLSQRQLERLFQYHLGYSPKKFIGIIRFLNAHNNIIENGTDNLSLLAHNFGYCDQAHFNKEYKKFTHFSPKDENMSILYNTDK